MVSRLIYSTIFYLILPLIVIRLLIRGLKADAYFNRWGERFGFLPKDIVFDRPIWIHTVSVGEFMAAIPIIKRLLAIHTTQIVVTSMTPTGSERVRAVFGEKVQHFYLPYDLPHIMSSLISRMNPKVLVIMETEIWPNMIYYSHKKGIPILLANARMSAKSAKGYQRFANLTRNTLDKMTLVGAQNSADAERFIALGVPRTKIQVMGNIKFDLSIPASLKEHSLAFRHQWGINRPVWIAASTHEGEDEIIIAELKHIQERISNLLLILVPRHPERFDKVANLVTKAGFRLIRRSEGHECRAETEVFLGDTMGELMVFFSASDLAFVGGSLIKSGGHNLLEPAALGLPVLFGPHMFNFAEVSRLMLEAKAGEQISDGATLAEAVIRLLSDSSIRAEIGERGIDVVDQNKGAINILVNHINHYVS